MLLIPKNWTKFQHYKDRCPPWIKLHRDLLNDKAFVRLPTAGKALAPLLWLLASESKDGVFDASTDELEFRLRMTKSEIAEGLNSLISQGFFIDASTMLAPCLQLATPETETERERETETEASCVSSKAKKYIAKNHLVESGASPDIVDEWFTVRKAKKRVNTERAIKKVLSEIALSGKTIDECLTVCVERSWAGFEAKWVDNLHSSAQQTETAGERMRRQMREFDEAAAL